MKKLLLIILWGLTPSIVLAQTYPVQKADECVFMNLISASGGTDNYVAQVTNPNNSVYTATDVSSFDTSDGGVSPTGSFRNIQLTLPYFIPVGSSIDFSARFYSANAGEAGIGSGNFEVRLVNSTIGNSGTTHVKLVNVTNKVGGAWQTEGGTSISASATDNTGITANGGFDTIIIFGVSTAGTSNETFYFDDITLNINPNLADEDADLDSGNVWIYNNREGDNQLAFSSFGATSVNENITTPSTDGNSASTVLRYTKANSFSTLAFDIPAITPPFSGSVKFRLYLDNCAPDLANNMRIRLQSSDNADFYQTDNADVITITDKKWVECSFNLANLTGSAVKDYDSFQIVVDQGDNADKTGFLYYFDAIQGPFAGSTTFTNGAGSSNWTVAGNWDGGVPTAISNAIIPAGNNVGIFGTVQTATNDLTLQGDASIFLQGPAPELIVNGNFTISTGTVAYRRRGLTTNWHLVSAPVSGVIFNNDAVLDDGTGSNQGLGIYNEASNLWSYKQTGVDVSATNGVGYSLRPETTSDFVFTGTTLNNSDVSVPVTNSSSGFNLLGNPFTASVKSASFLTANTANLVSETIWVWNQATSNYEAKVTADEFLLAPAQGFFTRSSNGTNLVIAKSSLTTGGAFQKSAKQELQLFMSDGESNRFVKIYYLEEATKGFDNGFDGETFGGVSNSLDVFTNLVADNQGKKYQVQSLPNSDYENTTIPVGIIAEAGKELTFTSETIGLPSGIKVFLEDRANGVFTRLDENNSSYKVTLDSALNDVGRFYLYTSSSALSTDDIRNSSDISIFSTSKNTLRITGLNGAASLEMYNVLGKQVLQSSFKSNGAPSDITLPNLSTGIYIVKLTSDSGNLNKKIILE